MMYNLGSQVQKQNAKQRFDSLLKKGCWIELTEKTNRTLNQNSYLHLIISYFAVCYGDTAEYCKQMFFKIKANSDLFIYERMNEKTGEFRKALRSSSVLTKSEMSQAIESFKNYSASIGILLPEAEDMNFVREAQKEIDDNKNFKTISQ